MINDIKPVLALLSEGLIDTNYGRFKIAVYHDGDEEAIVLSKGDLRGKEDVPCRLHSECISSHVFFGKECDCKEQMVKAQRLIQEKGYGLIIYLKQEGRGSGAAAHISTLDLKRQGMAQHEAYRMRGFPEDVRRYDIAAKIINHLNISSVTLLSTNLRKLETLREYNIKIYDSIDFTGECIEIGKITDTLGGYQEIGLHKPIDKTKCEKWIFVIGDLNVDYFISGKSVHDAILDKGPPIAGGTGFNAAKAFKDNGFEPIVFGKLGNDNEGRHIRRELANNKITSILRFTDEKPTGNCVVLFFEGENQRCLIKEEKNNANDYDIDALKIALVFCKINKEDFVFLVGHSFVRFGIDHTKRLIETIAQSGAKIILDVVPHNMHETIGIKDFNEAVGNRIDLMIGEYITLMNLIGDRVPSEKPNPEDWHSFFKSFHSNLLVVRYGVGNISKQTICKRTVGCDYQVLEETDTGYAEISTEKKRGFGDILTAESLARFLKEL